MAKIMCTFKESDDVVYVFVVKPDFDLLIVNTENINSLQVD